MMSMGAISDFIGFFQPWRKLDAPQKINQAGSVGEDTGFRLRSPQELGELYRSNRLLSAPNQPTGDGVESLNVNQVDVADSAAWSSTAPLGGTPLEKTVVFEKMRRRGELNVEQLTPLGTTTTSNRGLYKHILHTRPNIHSIDPNLIPPIQNFYAYHDHESHVLIATLAMRSAFDFKQRGDRSTLKPLLYPRLNKPFDRTHLIPFGYHGSEIDPYLVVGWSPEENQGPMNVYEQEVKNLNKLMHIVWCVEITRLQPRGAKLVYKIYDINTLRLAKPELVSIVNQPFVWRR